MKILAIDTAAKSCSVAIVDKKSLLAETTIVSGQTHSKHLMRMINAVIGLSGLSISDLDGFAVTSGPGSFTGLRIGISSVKGLAVASGRPVVSVSSLDVLAMQAAFSSYLICPLLDARKGEVYFSSYRFENDILKKEDKERVLPPGKAVCDINEPCMFVGDGASVYHKAIADKIGKLAHFAPPYQNTIRASTVAYLSMDRFEKNDTDDVGLFMPHYIRKSDAKLSALRCGHECLK